MNYCYLLLKNNLYIKKHNLSVNLNLKIISVIPKCFILYVFFLGDIYEYIKRTLGLF